jgi:TatD DNase family protein
MALIDTHCHLDLYREPKQVAEESARRGVYVLSMTTTPTAYIGTKALEPKDGRIRTALGLHPELAADREHELALFRRYLPTTRYVGEVGIDGSAPYRHTLDRQGRVLTSILDMCAAAGGRTISLHSRGAAGLVLDVIAQEPLAGQFILHWFSGSSNQVDRAIGLGCWFSVGPGMLRSERGMKIAAKLPMDRVLPETDGPFGTTGQEPLMPWEAHLVAAPLATAWAISIRDVQSRMAENFRRLIQGADRLAAVQ